MSNERNEILGPSTAFKGISSTASKAPITGAIGVKARCSTPRCGYIDDKPLPANAISEVRKCPKCLEEASFENILDGY